MDDLPITSRVTIPADEIEVAFVRSGGPGGQNVNKVATKVELRWRPGDSAALSADDRAWLLQRLDRRLTSTGELLVTSERTRNQARNRDDAAAKLAAIVRAALARPKRRKPTRAGRGAIERRLQAKRIRSRKKRDRQPPDDG